MAGSTVFTAFLEPLVISFGKVLGPDAILNLLIKISRGSCLVLDQFHWNQFQGALALFIPSGIICPIC